jgi:hypothetical protein
MEIVKVNRSRAAHYRQDRRFVYCGDRMPGYARSPLADTFRDLLKKGFTLAEVLALYKCWLDEMLAGTTPEALAVQAAFDQLRADSVLGCWCVNKPVAGVGEEACHCDVIAKAWEQRQAAAGARDTGG